MVAPKKLLQADYDKLIAACRSPEPIDASEFLEFVFTKAWTTGRRWRDILHSTDGRDAFQKLVNKAAAAAGVEL